MECKQKGYLGPIEQFTVISDRVAFIWQVLSRPRLATYSPESIRLGQRLLGRHRYEMLNTETEHIVEERSSRVV